MVRLYYSLAIATLAGATSTIHESFFAPEHIITRDVAIIGGGASGTYAAVRLPEDLNTSVVVIEAVDRLGGHINTYLDPISKVSVNYGVHAYLRYGNSLAFFERFNIPTTPYVQEAQNTVYVGTDTGSELTAYTPPSFPEIIGAFQTWLKFTEKYADILVPGLWKFPAGPDIPSELLLPLGEFAKLHGIEAAVPLFTVISNLGVGGIKEVLTLYAMLAMGPPVTREFLNSSLFVPANLSNSVLYDRAYDLLQDDVLLNSRVAAGIRSDNGVKLVVSSPDGGRKDLSFVAMARVPSIPSNTSLYYYAPDADTRNHLGIRDWPWTLTLKSAPRVPGDEHLFEVLFATNYSISHAGAKTTITEAVQNLTAFGTSSSNSSNCTVDFVAFGDHNSILWRQSVDELRSGIVQDVYALQGQHSTWYTSSVLSSDYTSNAWAFVDSLLPRLLASLGRKV